MKHYKYKTHDGIVFDIKRDNKVQCWDIIRDGTVISVTSSLRTARSLLTEMEY